MWTPQQVQSSTLPIKYTKKYSYSSPNFYNSNLVIFPQFPFSKQFSQMHSHGKSEATQNV